MSASTTLPQPKPSFPVRRMDFSFSETPKYWFYDDPFMSHFMNNLSSLFPYGEKFFVDSVRAVRDQVSEPQLKKRHQRLHRSGGHALQGACGLQRLCQ